jgi:hypothetical protein
LNTKVIIPHKIFFSVSKHYRDGQVVSIRFKPKKSLTTTLLLRLKDNKVTHVVYLNDVKVWNQSQLNAVYAIFYAKSNAFDLEVSF